MLSLVSLQDAGLNMLTCGTSCNSSKAATKTVNIPYTACPRNYLYYKATQKHLAHTVFARGALTLVFISHVHTEPFREIDL